MEQTKDPRKMPLCLMTNVVIAPFAYNLKTETRNL
ncbi:MAG: hypothetical protein QG577_1664 [Thermodesulfobacteriota bacterium]|nr:hypothetical protein [Thermodesulfobacteriota bacterium]